MKDRIFVDTNLLIYVYSKETEKEKVVYKLLSDLDFEIVISSQVISEFSNVINPQTCLF